MAKKTYHVIAKSNGEWSVKRNGAERATGNFSTKKGAITTARDLVTKSGGGELIIHEKDGRVSERNSFGSYPQRSKARGKMANRTYEVMYIGTPDAADEDITKLNKAIQQLIEKEGGMVVKTEAMGRRKLAYLIQKKTEGHHTLFEIEGSGQEIAELERRMQVNDTIMRFITVRVDEDRNRQGKSGINTNSRSIKKGKLAVSSASKEIVNTNPRSVKE
jgi:small subunit ribosomal protein S6